MSMNDIPHRMIFVTPIRPEPSEVYPACKASSDQAFENFKFQMERTLQLDTPLDADELAAAHGQAKTRALGDFDKDTGHFKGPVKNDIRQKLEVNLQTVFNMKYMLWE